MIMCEGGGLCVGEGGYEFSFVFEKYAKLLINWIKNFILIQENFEASRDKMKVTNTHFQFHKAHSYKWLINSYQLI